LSEIPIASGGGLYPSMGEVKVWDAQTGQELISFKGAGRDVAFSPDGHRLAGVMSDSRLIIWDATPLPEKP